MRTIRLAMGCSSQSLSLSLFRVYGSEGKGREREGSAHQSQSAVPAHAVTEDANAVRIQLLEVVEDGLGQFRRDVAVHSVACIPRRFRRVDVEAGARPEIVGVVFALDL